MNMSLLESSTYCTAHHRHEIETFASGCVGFQLSNSESLPLGVTQALRSPPQGHKTKIQAAKENSYRRVQDLKPSVKLHQSESSFRNCAVQLWMIDFNNVSTFDASVKRNYMGNIRQLIFGTKSTDGRYYSRVFAKNETEWNLWVCFSRNPIQASRAILKDTMESSEVIGCLTSDKEIIELVMKRPSHVVV
jgi:hypothetical protein